VKRFGASVICLCCSSVCLAAQATSGGASRGLFGRGSSGTDGQSVDVSATLVEAYDDNLLAERSVPSPLIPALSGYYTMLQTDGSYAWSSRKVQFGAKGASAFRTDAGLDQVKGISHSGGAGLSALLPGRLRLAVNQSVAYSPSYLFGLFPGANDPGLGSTRPAAPDYTVNDEASRSYSTTVAAEHGLTRRGTLTLGADYNRTDFVQQASKGRDGSAKGARAQFARRFGRHSAFRAGYNYTTSQFGGSVLGTSVDHGISVGVDHAWVLSATRGAEVSFALGGSAMDDPRSKQANLPGSRYRIAADVSGMYQFSRRGEIRGSYHRGLEHLLELNEPVFVDAVNASVSGGVGRRVILALTAGYSSGQSGVATASTFATYTTDLRSRIALTRNLSVFVQHLYFYYDFGQSGLLSPNVATRLERHGVRAGLTLSTPILRR
jgi:hypothetical protein